DWAVRIDVIRGVEIHRVDLGARDEGFKVGDLRAFDIQGLQLLGGKSHKPAALVFVAFDDRLALDLLAGVRVGRVTGETGGGRWFRLCLAGYILDERTHRRPGGLFFLFFVLNRSTACGLRLPNLMQPD